MRGGPSGHSYNISTPLSEPEGQLLCGSRWSEPGRREGRGRGLRPSAPFGPRLTPSGQQGCSPAQPVGQLMVLKEFEEVVHGSELVPGGPAFVIPVGMLGFPG